MSNEPKNGKLIPLSQIFIYFDKQVEVFILIPTN